MAQPFNFTFGQDFFNAYQQSQRQKEEERQFNLKFGEEQRQRSLLDAFKQRDYELAVDTYNLNAENIRADNARMEAEANKQKPFISAYESGYTKIDETTGEPTFVQFPNTPKSTKTIKSLIPGTNNYGEYDPNSKDFVRDAKGKPLIVDINKPTKETSPTDYEMPIEEIDKLIKEEEDKGFLGDPTTIRQLKIEKIKMLSKQNKKKATEKSSKPKIKY
ncbi:MAG: hypothetical protein WC974_08615 [Thermoplasmata archaeon]